MTTQRQAGSLTHQGVAERKRAQSPNLSALRYTRSCRGVGELFPCRNQEHEFALVRQLY